MNSSKKDIIISFIVKIAKAVGWTIVFFVTSLIPLFIYLVQYFKENQNIPLNYQEYAIRIIPICIPIVIMNLFIGEIKNKIFQFFEFVILIMGGIYLMLVEPNDYPVDNFFCNNITPIVYIGTFIIAVASYYFSPPKLDLDNNEDEKRRKQIQDKVKW